MNKSSEHVYVIPEDDADRQIAVGFIEHHSVKDSRIKVMPVAGGWMNVLKTFVDEYIQNLKNNPKAHVVMLIDFDGWFEQRRKKFEQEIPDEIKPRVFVVGSKNTPQTLKRALNYQFSFSKIGDSLADECATGITKLWGHEQLTHNDPDRQHLNLTVKPFLF